MRLRSRLDTVQPKKRETKTPESHVLSLQPYPKPSTLDTSSLSPRWTALVAEQPELGEPGALRPVIGVAPRQLKKLRKLSGGLERALGVYGSLGVWG